MNTESMAPSNSHLLVVSEFFGNEAAGDSDSLVIVH